MFVWIYLIAIKASLKCLKFILRSLVKSHQQDMGESLVRMSYGNATRPYSPVTLNQDWPPLIRLVFIVLLATIGTIINGFFVAAFFVERPLKRIGNVYLACVGIADLIISSVVMPVSAVVLLSGQWDILPVCRVLQFLTETSTYCYSLFFAFVALETYCRLCYTDSVYQMYLGLNVAFFCPLVFVFSMIMAGVGVYLDLDYDYCERLHRGNFLFRATTLGLFHALPFFITIYALFGSAFCISRRARCQNHYRRSQQYDRDSSTTNLNILVYLIYVTCWLPYLIVQHEHPDSSDSRYYHAVWLGLFRSIVTSLLYCCLNINFRRGFAHIFNYCCCKSSLTDPFASRHRRILEYKCASGDVRVHIMHQAVSTNSPQRSSSAARETQEL